MIKLHLKSNIDLRQAETVTVAFYKDDKILLTKTGEDLDIKQSRVDLELSADDIALWEPGRYIGIDVKAFYADGSDLESNYVYRSFDVTQSRTEYWANTYFGDDEPHHSDVVDTSDATLPDGSKMLAPYTAYARGNKYTGTIQTYAGQFMPVLDAIAFTTQPTQTEYDDGDDIDLTGAVVKAFYPNNKPWEGTIALSGLTITPDKADKSQATPVVYSNDAGTINAIRLVLDVDGHSTYDDRFAIWWHYSKDIGNGYAITNSSTTSGLVQYLTKYNGHIYSASETGAQYCDLGKYTSGDPKPRRVTSSSSPTGAGEFKYMSDLNDYVSYLTSVPESTADPANYAITNLHKAGGEQTISVEWENPYDGETLETELTITIDDEEEEEA